MKLTGKRTYMAALAMAFTAFAKGMGWLTEDQAKTAYDLLLAAGIWFLRTAACEGEKEDDVKICQVEIAKG